MASGRRHPGPAPELVGSPAGDVNQGKGCLSEWRELVAAQGFQPAQELRSFAHQALDVDRHACRPVGLKFFQALAQLGDGPMPVTPSPVVEADSDLEDSLVEVADRIRLGDPDGLKGLVLFEEFLAIELVDTGEQ